MSAQLNVASATSGHIGSSDAGDMESQAGISCTLGPTTGVLIGYGFNLSADATGVRTLLTKPTGPDGKSDVARPSVLDAHARRLQAVACDS